MPPVKGLANQPEREKYHKEFSLACKAVARLALVLSEEPPTRCINVSRDMPRITAIRQLLENTSKEVEGMKFTPSLNKKRRNHAARQSTTG